MAKGDKIIIGTGYFWKESDNQKVMAYMPKLDENKKWIIVLEKTVLVESVGGVTAGSTGVIDGELIKVDRSHIKSVVTGASMGGDWIELVPVYLEKYQRLGYFPVDNVRIIGG